MPNQKFSLKHNSIRLEKIGKVRVVIDRVIPIDSKFMSVTVSKNKCNQFFASILIETKIIAKEKTGKSIGMDIGIKSFLTLSNNAIVANPLYFRESQAKLAKVQKHLSRKLKGSKRRQKAKLKVARIHINIANKRKDFIHKTTTQLINEYDIIAIEDLNVAGMVKNHNTLNLFLMLLLLSLIMYSIIKRIGMVKKLLKLIDGLRVLKFALVVVGKTITYHYRIEYLNVKSVN
ncbi:MAG: transposase [Methylococcaceae bacterium]